MSENHEPTLAMNKLASLLLMASLALPLIGLGQSAPVRQKQYNLNQGLAIQGYDPVAYFIQNKAVKGAATHTLAYKNVTYRFASQANLDLFQKSPDRYEPQYGGWCAYAMGATGEKVEIDPKTFRLKDGKLYLFYNQFFNNTLPKWTKDEDNLHRKADQNWVKVIG
jgi:YHS domain-containing protein